MQCPSACLEAAAGVPDHVPESVDHISMIPAAAVTRVGGLPDDPVDGDPQRIMETEVC